MSSPYEESHYAQHLIGLHEPELPAIGSGRDDSLADCCLPPCGSSALLGGRDAHFCSVSIGVGCEFHRELVCEDVGGQGADVTLHFKMIWEWGGSMAEGGKEGVVGCIAIR